MKHKILLLSLMLSAPALAGTQSTYEAPPQQPMAQETLWQWFIGGTGGYLFEFDEDIYTLQIGANSPWSFNGWNVALYVEAGWTENHDQSPPPGPFGGDPDLNIVPILFNVKFEKVLTGGLSAYIGGGAGPSYVESNLSSPFGGDDWVFTAQVFTGLAYHFTDNFEIFAGARYIFFDNPDFGGVSLDDDVMVEGGLRFHF